MSRVRAVLPCRARPIATALLLACVLAGCAAPRGGGVAELLERPAERALLAGMRAYEEGQYAQAERELGAALAAGLASPRDRASAHKLLAFVYCTSSRIAECERAFREARRADPAFALVRAEAGHPLWGPVYRRVSAAP